MDLVTNHHVLVFSWRKKFLNLSCDFLLNFLEAVIQVFKRVEIMFNVLKTTKCHGKFSWENRKPRNEDFPPTCTRNATLEVKENPIEPRN